MNSSYNTPSSTGNLSLVNHLIKQKIVTSQAVADCMASVDRGYYSSENPYADKPQGIGYMATISAPHMHAYALELLRDHLANGSRVLDVGSGSGYLTVCFAKMMNDPKGVVYGIEHIPELVKLSIANVKKSPDADLLTSGRVVLKEGDGRKGMKEFAPFDAIHVGAAAEKLPQELVDQLAKGGRMVIPVGKHGEQDFLIVDKDKNGQIRVNKALGVTYVPLTDKEMQWPSTRGNLLHA
jgi:protein-L-isoaspartate(D-aspartate) O-methyltransferase